MRTTATAIVLVMMFGACGESAPDACDALQPRFMTTFEQRLRDAEARGNGPASSGTFEGMFNMPNRPSPVERELAHVRAHFAGACRAVGAPELTRCMDLADKNRALPREQRPAEDDACKRLDKAFEAALYRGFE